MNKLDMLVKTVKEISEYCDRQENCSRCEFFMNRKEQRDYMERYGIECRCQLKALGQEFKYHPSAWDMENIEWLMRQ